MGFTNRNGVDDALKSATSKATHLPFRTSFEDNSTYNGSFYRDTVRLGGAILEKVEFGVAEKAKDIVELGQGTDSGGLIGVGLEANEATVRWDQPQYPNIVSHLHTNGLIGTKAFSLYINSKGTYIQVPQQSVIGNPTKKPLDAATGSILFGGVDSSLYTGPLIMVPMVKRPEEPQLREYAVQWTSFTASSQSGSGSLRGDDIPIHSHLDSGTTYTEIPGTLLPALYKWLGAREDADGDFVVPCNSFDNSSETLTFGFGDPSGPTIVAPVSAFIDPYDPDVLSPYEDKRPACIVGIVDSNTTSATLGDNFLHSAYLVYDIDAKVIAMAQANFSPSKERHVLEIRSGSSGIPGVTRSVPELPGRESLLGNLSAVGTASGAVASATGVLGGDVPATGVPGGNIPATAIHPPIPGFTGAADRTRRFGMETLMLGVAVSLCAMMWQIPR